MLIKKLLKTLNVDTYTIKTFAAAGALKLYDLTRELVDCWKLLLLLLNGFPKIGYAHAWCFWTAVVRPVLLCNFCPPVLVFWRC